MSRTERMLVAFTPSLMSTETLEAIFVRREPLAARLMQSIRESAFSETRKHSLLVGPRGIGKTHLVSLLYHRIKADEPLADRVRIAWLREETWEVSSFLDLMQSVLEALAKEYGDGVLAAESEGLNRLSAADAQASAETLLANFLGDRLLLIIVENLGDLFDSVGEEGQRQLRALLQNRRNAILLASTPALFYGVSDHDAAFYGFFNVHHLDELTVDDARELLCKVARLREDRELEAFLQTPAARARLEVVQALAGGHPRIWLLFAAVITRHELDELLPLFLHMLDDLTPYYQSRMKELPAQQRKIAAFLAKSRGAVPVKEIANGCRLSQQAAAAQLGQLARDGFVRFERRGRESWYELREPLMRLVLEVKESRGNPIRLIVDFLRCWYSRAERKVLLAGIAPQSRVTLAYLHAALDLAGPVPAVSRVWSSCDDQLRVRELMGSGHCEAALELAEELIESANSDASFLWAMRGFCLASLERLESAHQSFDRAIEADPNVAIAHFGKGVLYQHSGQDVQALWSYDKAIEIDPANSLAHAKRGSTLLLLQRWAEALASFETSCRLDPNDSEAQFRRGIALSLLGQYENALGAFDRALSIEPANARMLASRGFLLHLLGQRSDALRDVDRAVEVNPSDTEYHFIRATVVLGYDWNEFLGSIDRGLTFLPTYNGLGPVQFVSWFGSILRDADHRESWTDRLSDVIDIFDRHSSLSFIGRLLTLSVLDLFGPDATIGLAVDWLNSWEVAAQGHEELEIPVRLLRAAVEWKHKPDRRILLGLPAEERKVLEELLPSGGIVEGDMSKAIDR